MENWIVFWDYKIVLIAIRIKKFDLNHGVIVITLTKNQINLNHVATLKHNLWLRMYKKVTLRSADLPHVWANHSTHSILFQTIQLSNPTNHSIPFHFFSTLFFNFPNPYTISLNLNHLYHLKIRKVKLFYLPLVWPTHFTYSILFYFFTFFNFSNPPNHSILFHFF